MKRIFDYFGFDGLQHIICCNLLVVLINIMLPLWVALTVAVLFALGKEFVWDTLLGKGTFDKKDLVADGIGVLIGCL